MSASEIYSRLSVLYVSLKFKAERAASVYEDSDGDSSGFAYFNHVYLMAQVDILEYLLKEFEGYENS